MATHSHGKGSGDGAVASAAGGALWFEQPTSFHAATENQSCCPGVSFAGSPWLLRPNCATRYPLPALASPPFASVFSVTCCARRLSYA